MLLTLTTTFQPATDLGFLLHKNPTRAQTFNLAFGQAHVFYPEATEQRCMAALLLDIDPVGLVRRESRSGFALEQYVNDRPYVSSSFLSVAIADVFRSALNGISKDRPELVVTDLPLEARVTALPCHGGETLLKSLFEPLGYTLTAERYVLDSRFPAWGESKYYTVALSQTIQLQTLLSHLYVLLPVLDNDKHYYVGSDEIEKLLRHGEGWLGKHPQAELITRRYLRHKSTLAKDALARVIEPESVQAEDQIVVANTAEQVVEEKINLHQQRLGAVIAMLKSLGARRVLDLGCGEGQLLRLLIKESQFSAILGMDVSFRALEMATDKLHLDQMPPMQRARIELIHGSLMYRDPRLSGYDAAAVVEVIEHLDPPRLKAFERVVFEFAIPDAVIITTPNAEYNVMWETLSAGIFRHKDHRFEWTRAEFQAWANEMCARFGYTVRYLGIGDEHPEYGSPTQMAVFEKQITNVMNGSGSEST